MTPAERERFREAEKIFYAAIERPAGVDRDTLVREQCGADQNLCARVARLLEHHEHIRAATPAPTQQMPRFGAWQAVKLLGRGGMGTVYLAERADGAFSMSAAVKVVPLALASHEIEERFRRERQFLAGLDHPKVARLIDGGVSETGLPYLVMELVDGLTIDSFSDVHDLDTRSRIALMRQVLEALAYVHGRQVIHRDVKPSNIMVDDSGNVKLLDFGTARLVDATAEAALTKTGVFAFTPEYASPEQVRGEAVGAASDLYSAGVLLYRLLVRRLPYEIADTSPAGAAKVIARGQPEPSRLEAPLDAILSKALSREAADRYQSATEMDADLLRYLEGQRVRARKSGRKAWAKMAVGLVIAATGVLGFRLWQAPRDAHYLAPFDTGAPNAMQPALSYDGQWLAFASAGKDGTHPDIWLKPMPNGEPRRVTSGDATNDEPTLSPDGQWLAFHSARSPAGIYLQSAAPSGSRAARLLIEGGRVPRFSPDGQWVAYLNNGENRGDTSASSMSMLYRVPAKGGAPVRLARNASSVQGAAWSSDSRDVLFLAADEQGMLRLWRAPLDGAPAALISDFTDPVHLDARACATAGNRFLYTVVAHTPGLSGFLLKPAFRADRYSFVAAASRFEISGCAASADGIILADEVDNRSNAWMLSIDAERGTALGLPTALTKLEHGDHLAQFSPDGATFLLVSAATRFLQDYRTGFRRPLPGTRDLSSDGAFVLQEGKRETSRDPAILQVLSLKTGEWWGRMETDGVPWDLSNGGRWMLAASAAVHRTIMAWDTKSAEHQPIYAHPSANLYLANFSKDGRWVVFTSEEGNRQPHMWAAPFRDLQSIPVTEWVDLGEGDYPRWSPAGGRIYFTRMQDGFECISTRGVDPVTKRPVGPVTAVQHFHGRLTPQGLRPGTFRISVAQDKIAFALGERVHQLLQWQ